VEVQVQLEKLVNQEKPDQLVKPDQRAIQVKQDRQDKLDQLVKVDQLDQPVIPVKPDVQDQPD
jgi:hypothetical protein